MENKVNQLWREIFGNGNEGLKVDIAKIKQILKDMKEREAKMETALSGINKFVSEVDTDFKQFAAEVKTCMENIDKRYNNDRKRKRAQTTTVIMIIGIAASVLISILTLIFKT